VTIVEYALIIGSVAVGSISSFDMLDTSVAENYASTAASIGQSDLSTFDAATTTTEAPDSTTTTTESPDSTTTTTEAPDSTTTTIESPDSTTTTTEAPDSTTTTTEAPEKESLSLESEDQSDDDHGDYKAKIRLTIDDESGHDLEGAEVTVLFTLDDGTTGVASGETNSDGKVSFEWKDLKEDDFTVIVTVTSVTKDGVSYDAGSDDYRLEKP